MSLSQLAKPPLRRCCVRRFAAYADRRYRDLKSQRSQPEFHTQAAVIQKKARHCDTLRQRMQAEHNPKMREAIAAQIERAERPVRMDQAAMAALQAGGIVPFAFNVLSLSLCIHFPILRLSFALH